MRIMILSALALAVLAAFSAVGSVVANGGSNGLGYSATPLGVIILTARGGMDMGRGGSVGLYFADANGMTLYTFDKDPTGQSVCNGECAANWPPLSAVAGAAPTGEWSIVNRDNGVGQWAYRGKPLYIFVKDQKLGDRHGDNAAEIWHLAAFAPNEGVKIPQGTIVRELVNAPGHAFVNAEGFTLYFHDADPIGGQLTCTGSCTDIWRPHLASAVANSVGDFSVVSRIDGFNQWV